MTLSNEIFKTWRHSFEESTNEVIVYRPAGYKFPRARGRAGIELKSDGTFVDLVIGPGDGLQDINGHWQEKDPGSVVVSFEGNVRAPRVIEILQCDAEILRVRQKPFNKFDIFMYV